MNYSIVIPAHNEEANLNKLIRNIQGICAKFKLKSEIIIVDDNSTDNTGKIADSFSKQYEQIRVIHRNCNPGMGNSLKEGTDKSKGKVVVWVMGDNSDDLTTIPKMIKKVEQGYDIVFGSRYMKDGSSGDLDPFKALSSSSYTKLIKFVFGIKINDITNAFRAFKRESYDKLRIESSDFTISPEFAIKAHIKGLKLAEVPTTYSNRKAGKTKFKMVKMGIKYLSLMRYRFL